MSKLKFIKLFENFDKDISWSDANKISDEVNKEKNSELLKKTEEHFSDPIRSYRTVEDELREGTTGEEHHISGIINDLCGDKGWKDLDWKQRLDIYHTVRKGKSKWAELPISENFNMNESMPTYEALLDGALANSAVMILSVAAKAARAFRTDNPLEAEELDVKLSRAEKYFRKLISNIKEKSIIKKIENNQEIKDIVNNYKTRFGNRELSNNDLQTLYSKISRVLDRILDEDERKTFDNLSKKIWRY
jgi:hypothetical protein